MEEQRGMHKWIRYKSESARNFERALSNIVGWLLNFLKRNKWVLRRITTSRRDLPDNSIETILNFLVEMKQHFIDVKKDFD